MAFNIILITSHAVMEMYWMVSSGDPVEKISATTKQLSHVVTIKLTTDRTGNHVEIPVMILKINFVHKIKYTTGKGRCSVDIQHMIQEIKAVVRERCMMDQGTSRVENHAIIQRHRPAARNRFLTE